jgi:hypothetical protein
MPKAVRVSKSPSSPGSSEPGSARPPAGSTNSCKSDSSSAGPLTSSEPWPAHLDDDLAMFLADRPNSEADAIAAIRASYPHFDEELIWARIVYLGLTRRKRPPYKRHVWSEAEDEILKQHYGCSKAASQQAIEKILELHPDWSRDAIVWRARALGLTQRRERAHQTWTPVLDHLLLSLQGCQPDTIATRLGCTTESVVGRLRRLGWGAEFFGGFKTKDLVRELRVPEAAIERWVRLSWLQRKRGRITEKSLRWLCRNHPEEIPFETLAPEARNWLKLSMGYGVGASAQRRDQKKD